MKICRPFEKLMEMVQEVHVVESPGITLGELSERWGEPERRIMDAIDAVRVKNGERTYITLDDNDG